MMKIIFTVSGDSVMVDDALYPALATKTWYTVRSHQSATCYARTYHKGQHLYMHRLIMGEPEGMVVDHLDEHGLNNQRENLEVITLEANSRRVTIRAKARIAYDRWKQAENEKVYTSE